MKRKFIKIIKKTADWLLYLHAKYSNKEKYHNKFHSLSPTDEAEKSEHYIESLNWALQNRNKIKNIAIAGSYGSGKSSVIKTFQKRNTNKDLHFFNISLATFKEEKEPQNKCNDDVLRLIELSILQQLFYHEDDKKIPDSRFKKIKNNKTIALYLLSFGFVFFAISFINLIYPNFLSEILLTNIPKTISKGIHYTSLILVLFGFGYITFKSIRVFKGLVIKKIGFQSAEIQLDDKISKSILNNHIDEILYFFEVTKYNTIVIEDLDRFEQTEVFTKLREINLLINNSNKVKQDIVFIYAIRDDMFKDNDRTKFFDFIIPIIPVINSSNSKEKLSKVIKKNNYSINEELIDNISLFIYDMRLLFNIMNEYYIYKESLSDNLDSDNLLAMVVYKNIYPNDFTKLGNGGGVLHHLLNNKKSYINNLTKENNKKISQLKIEIDTLTDIRINDIKELRTIYIMKIINRLTSNNTSFKTFFINNQIISLDKIVEDTYFDLFFNNIDTIQYLQNNNNSTKQRINLKIASIEKEVNAKNTYKEREQLINDYNDNKIERLISDIEKLENTIKNVKKYKIKNLYSNEYIVSEIKTKNNESTNKKQTELISILLRNGYIDEDYIEYISIFYEGSLSKADYQFLISVKTQKKTDFEFKLYKFNELIKRINNFDFEKEYILNFSLLDYLLSNDNNKSEKEKIFSLLENESNTSIKFIEGFIDYTSNIELFSNLLFNKWTNVWNFIEKKSKISKEKREIYFNLIINYADVSDIKIIFYNFKTIVNNKNLFRIKNTSKLKNIIKELNIKFIDIGEDCSNEMLDFIYNGNYYAITNKMLKVILKHKESFNQKDFDTKNYSLINKTGLENLLEYIDNNINTYINSIFLNSETNTNEDIDYYIELLNNDDISIENRERIITQTETIIEDIDDVHEKRFTNILLEQLKIIPTWENVISIYIQFGNVLEDELITFIEIHVKILSNKEIEYEDEEVLEDFVKTIILENKIKDNNYETLLKSIPNITHDIFSFSDLSFEKNEILVRNKLIEIDDDYFEILKENFSNLHILLVEHNVEYFIENIDSFELEIEDVIALLKSNIISLKNKEIIINYFDVSFFTESTILLTQIGELLLESYIINIDKDIIKYVLTDSNLKTVKRIEIFNKKQDLFDNYEIEDILLSLEEPYSKIAKKRKRPLIENNSVNTKFARILKSKRYISKFDIEKKGIRISTFSK